ncbi:hypothetical protein [Streptomyces collinus]|uniref:hypothetical protein n=1 Tax=Streptomyces collinus TaxID=42684 RepID=UPI0036418582
MEDRDKIKAQMRHTLAASHRATARAHSLTATMEEWGATFRKVYDAITAAEARELAEHPDLAEWNAQMDAFYGDV